MIFLDQEQIRQMLTYETAIRLMRQVFESIGKGEVNLPERIVMETGVGGDSLLIMPASIPKMNGLGTKIISVFPSNKERGLPTAFAVIVLNDPVTGSVRAVLEGGWITAVRTAAVSALAADLLAVSGASAMTVFGAGAQGESHIRAFRTVRRIEEVFIQDPDRERAFRLAERLKQDFPDCRFHSNESSERAIRNSSLIVAATTSSIPVFDGEWLNPGSHITAIGSFKPSVREVDDATVRRARIFVDSFDHALSEAGDLLIPLAEGTIERSRIEAQLADLVAGSEGRRNREEITLFKSVGMAAEDIAVASALIQEAGKRSPGTKNDSNFRSGHV